MLNKTEEVKLDCGGGHEIVVKGEKLAAYFTSVGRSAEQRVAEVQKTSPGLIRTLQHLQNGKKNDWEGEAAVQVFDDQGRLTEKIHYAGDRPTDTATEPAFQQFDGETGRLMAKYHYVGGKLNDTTEPAVMMEYIEGRVTWKRYRDGVRNDGVNDEPATESYVDGSLTLREHYRDGVRNDGLNGEPGYQFFNKKGQLIRSEHWKNNEFEKQDHRLRCFIARKFGR